MATPRPDSAMSERASEEKLDLLRNIANYYTLNPD
jgi:hypothetical protein